MRALTRDPHRFRDMSDRYPLLDPFDQKSTAMDCETSVTVRHEDLRVGVKRQTPLHSEVFTPSTRHQRHGQVQLDLPNGQRLP